MLEVVSGFALSFYVVEQVDVVARDAGNYDSIHGMVAMVDAFLVKALTQFDRNGWNGVSFGGGCGIVGGSCNGVQPFESRQYDPIPHVVDAPVVFQAVGGGAITCNDIL